MKTKNLVMSAILLGIGTVLHFITPPILFGIKPDFLLVMMFIGIFISRDLKSTLVISLAAGIIAAMTTNFPMGQIPNILDKMISGYFVYLYYSSMNFQVNNVKMAIGNGLGTLLSGLIFLASALYLIGQLDMFVSSLPVVLVTIPINIVIGVLIFNTFKLSLKAKAF